MRFKRLYNSVMVRGERVIAVSDQIAELIVERHRRRARAHRGRAGEHRHGALRSGGGLGGAARRHPPRLGRHAGHQGHSGGRPHAPPQGPSCGGQGGASAEGARPEGFRLRVRRRGSGPHPLYRRIVGPGQRDRNQRRGAARRRGRATCRRPMRPRPSWSRPSIQPEGLQRAILEAQAHGAPGRGVRSRGRTRRRARAARGSGGPHDRIARSGGRRGGARGGPHPLVFIERCAPRRDRGARPRLGRRTFRCGEHRARDALRFMPT